MNVTIDLSEQNTAALEAQARAAHMAPERYLSTIVARALHSRHAGETSEQPAGQTLKPRKSAYGLLAKYGHRPTEEEIDENRREMFNGFGEISPVIAGVADTHAPLWYLLKNPDLSATARRFMDDAAAAGEDIVVSPISLAEIV